MIAIIEKWASNGAKYIVANSTRQVSPDVLQFGLHLLIELAIKVVVWLVIGVLLKDWAAWFFVFTGFIVTRIIIGGVHAKSFLKCLVWSSFVLLGAYGLSLVCLSTLISNEMTQVSLLVVLLGLFFGVWWNGIPLQIGARKKTKKRIFYTNVFAWLWMTLLFVLLMFIDTGVYALVCGAIVCLVVSFKALQSLINSDT